MGKAEWLLCVSSPAEALAAIEANTGKLYRYLAQAGGGYAEYRVVVNNKDIQDYNELAMPARSDRTFDIIPVAQGAGSNNGIWMALVGIVLVIAAIYTAGASLGFASGWGALASGGAASTGFTAAFSSMALTIGVSLTLGGIVQMLSPVPKNNEPSESPNNRPSYLFNGATNTTRQGNPCPLGYGEVICGSQVVSSGMRATDLPTLTVWSVSVVYVENAEVQYGDRYYASLVNNNLGHTPPTYPVLTNAYWTDVTST